MANFVGADWASNGWVAAELDDEGGLSVGFYPTIWNLWYDCGDEAAQILVDIPIGLAEDERRECDREARTFLEDRRSSVFWTPIRDAVYEDNIEDAKAVQTDAMEHSISNQAWAIVPRIREVDTFLREGDGARDVVRESHPEVCFRQLNGDEFVETKTSDDGLEDRRNVLETETPVTAEDCDRAIGILAAPSYARFATADDVLDAIVLAVTAKRVADGDYALFPEQSASAERHPPADETGLPMEIVYPEA